MLSKKDFFFLLSLQRIKNAWEIGISETLQQVGGEKTNIQYGFGYGKHLVCIFFMWYFNIVKFWFYFVVKKSKYRKIDHFQCEIEIRKFEIS